MALAHETDVNVSKFAKVTALVLFAVSCPRVSDAADLTLEWDPPNDGIATGYVISYGTASRSYSQQVDVGNRTSYTLSGLFNGTTYYFAVRTYDAEGVMSALSAEVSATIASNVPPVVTALALTSNVPSPQVTGTSVIWRAAATGGIAPYQFQWALYGAGKWTVYPWTTAATWIWTPSSVGSDYKVRVAVRSSGSSSTLGEMIQTVPFAVTAPRAAAVTLAPSLAAPQRVGTTIRWSAAASGGASSYQYRFWLFNGRVWSATTGWTTSSTWSWTPAARNNDYIVRVGVRSTGVSTGAEAFASVPFPISR